jgi:hypothetical protein
MVCYAPRAGTIIGAGILGYALLHKLILRVLHIAGLVLEVALITGVAAAAALLLAWAVRATSRRRAARGACTTCRFRCQRALTPVATVPVPTVPVLGVRNRTRATAVPEPLSPGAANRSRLAA